MVESWERARHIPTRAGIPPGSLTDGSRYVLKCAPTARGMRYESRLLAAEAEFCRVAAEAEVPAPRVVALDGVRQLLLTACPGHPWGDSLTDTEQTVLRAEPGRQVARLHRLTGPGFGYPTGALGPLAPDWRTAFTTMYDGARTYGAGLPRSVDEAARTARAARDALDEVTVARPVHFDLWQGNILVDRSAGEPRIGGLIDGERMFWGDPLAEFDVPARLRLALCRSYLCLIMLVEPVLPAVGEERALAVRELVAPELVAALDEIDELADA